MRSVVRWGFVAGFVVFAAAAQADNWPSHLIKATIPFGAGSAADVVPRVVFDRLAAELGQAIVVENRPGAGGTIGTATVVKADAEIVSAFDGDADLLMPGDAVGAEAG